MKFRLSMTARVLGHKESDFSVRPGACFSKVPKLFGRISADIILFVSSKRRRLEARNFAVILIFIPFTTYEKTSFTEKAGRSFTNGFSGPKSSRDFRETGPRTRFEKEAKGNSEMAYSHTPYSKCSTGEGLRRRTIKGEGHPYQYIFFSVSYSILFLECQVNKCLPFIGLGNPLYVNLFPIHAVPSPLHTPQRSNTFDDPNSLSHPNV